MKRKEEYLASRLAREALEDIKFPKNLEYDEIRPYLTQRDSYRSESDLNDAILGCAVFSEYLKIRQAYRFHPVLAKELSESTNLNFGIQDLHLPYNTFYMDLSECGIWVDEKGIVGVYVHIHPENHMLAFVALVRINPKQVVFMKASTDYSDGKTIEEMFDDITGGYSNEKELYRCIFALLSYISSEKPDIADRGKETVMVKTRNRKMVPSTTRRWDVGYRYMEFYRREMESILEEEHSAGGTHQSPRRHLRAAHWHTYRYGPGKQLRKVLWVQACWVGKGDEDVDVIHVTKGE